jgi:hypothetical protein
MSTAEMILICSAFLILCSATSFLVGHARGVKQGRDEQWVEDFMSSIKRDKSRRNALGQFKPKNQITKP